MDELREATRDAARLRDALIERTRNGDAAAQRTLHEVNALLSELVAAEFPLAGVRRERIEKARAALARLAESL